MRLLYFDCFSGISGYMVLGALLDAGLPLDELKRALGSLAVSGYEIDARKVLRAGVSSTKFVVQDASNASTQHQHEHTAHSTQHEPSAPGTKHQAHGHAHRGLPDIFKLIDGSALSADGRDRAKALFKRLAERSEEHTSELQSLRH